MKQSMSSKTIRKNSNGNNMDYKEKYEQALMIAQETYNTQPMYREWIEKMFSELKESEDERIRGAIIDHLKDNNLTEWAAWLEKQGDKDKFIEKELGCIKGYRENAIKRLEKLEKQDGQERDVLEDAILDSNEDGLIAETIRYKNEKQGEQKPAEWSSEDEQNLNAALGYIPDEFLKRWLKNVVHAKYDKSVWSEDDERNSSYICTALDCYYRLREERNNTNGQEGLDKARNWLHNKIKSLKPKNKWKPSDEQMELLSEVQNALLGKDCHNRFTDFMWELKKLKEGRYESK